MTIASTLTQWQYDGNASATAFSYNAKIFAATDLAVALIDSSGNYSQQPSNAYSVTGVGTDGGGLVIFNTPPPVGTKNVDIRSAIPVIQGTSIKNQGQFLPELHEDALDRLTRTVQDLTRRALTYGLHAPDTEQLPWPAIPSINARKGLVQMYDPVTGLPTVGAPAGVIYTGPTLGALIFDQTPAEALALVTPANMKYQAGLIPRYNGILDGATDCVAALAQAMSVGQEVIIDGPCALASASLAALPNKGIAIAIGTKLRCTPAGSITITGTTPCNVFYSTDTQGIHFESLSVLGNGNAGGTITTTTGYFWYHKMTAAAVADQRSFKMLNCTLANFGGLYWAYFDNTLATNSTGFAMRDVRIENNTFISASGNAQSPALITYTACCVAFSGSDIVTNYASMTDIHVNGNTAYGQYMKQFCIFWSGVNRAFCTRNILSGFGTDGSFTNDTGCYAILVYDHAHGTGLFPDSIEINHNIIQGVRDCGIYLAAVGRVNCNGNRISGQTSTANGTIPKAAIAIGGGPLSTSIVSVNDTTIDGCYTGITAIASQGSDLTITKTHITNVLAGGMGILVQPTGTGNVGIVVVDGIKVHSPNATVTACRIDSNATVSLGYCSLLNFDFDVLYTGITQVSVGATTPSYGLIKLANGFIRNTGNAGINWVNCSNAATRLVLENIEFYGQQLNCAVLNLNATVGLRVNGITFHDMATGGTGFCWYAAGSQGSVESVRYRNIAVANRYTPGTDFGIGAPAWTGNLTDYVQNLNPTVTGTGGFGTVNQKQWTAGWGWDRVNANWAPDVRLTGA